MTAPDNRRRGATEQRDRGVRPSSRHGLGRCLPIQVAAQMISVERAINAERLADDEADAGRDALPVAREFWRHPTMAELQRRRIETDEPCPARCAACSRCVRAESVARNLARFGSPDWPGGHVRGVGISRRLVAAVNA